MTQTTAPVWSGERKRVVGHKWSWPEAETAFGLVYLIHTQMDSHKQAKNIFESLARCLGRTERAVATHLYAYLARNESTLPQLIRSKLKEAPPVPMAEACAYLDKLLGHQLTKRQRANALLHQGLPHQRSREIAGALARIPEVEYDLDAFFSSIKTQDTEGEGRAKATSPGRFSPERAPEKERVRKQLICIAKEHLYKPMFAFDLPGQDGLSSIKIKEAFPSIKILGAESNPDIARAIQRKVASGEIPLEHLYACNATDAFRAHAEALLRPFDLVNMDVCGLWSESLVASLTALLENRLLANNGLLAITHLAVRDHRRSMYEVLRYTLNLPPRVGSLEIAARKFTRDEVRQLISGFIQRAAIQHSYNLTPVVEPFEYADDSRSPMSVYVFKAEHPLADPKACQTKADLLEFEWVQSMVHPNKREGFIEFLIGEYVRTLDVDQRENFGGRLFDILNGVEQEE